MSGKGKKNRLFAMPTTLKTMEAVEKHRFVRITPDYTLIYAPPRKPRGSVEVGETDINRLTPADESWLIDCVAALAAETILKSDGESQRKLGSMIEQLEQELKAEVEAMKGGDVADESG